MRRIVDGAEECAANGHPYEDEREIATHRPLSFHETRELTRAAMAALAQHCIEGRRCCNIPRWNGTASTASYHGRVSSNTSVMRASGADDLGVGRRIVCNFVSSILESS
jgi:hypothetical protein